MNHFEWKCFQPNSSTNKEMKWKKWHWLTATDTKLNYYYFQMTKHDVTNRLPCFSKSQREWKEGTLKDGKKSFLFVETWTAKKKLWKVFVFFLLKSVFVLNLFSSSSAYFLGSLNSRWFLNFQPIEHSYANPRESDDSILHVVVLPTTRLL